MEAHGITTAVISWWGQSEKSYATDTHGLDRCDFISCVYAIDYIFPFSSL